MNTLTSRNFIGLVAISTLSLPLTVAAQSTARTEVFGGYSYLGLGEQSAPGFAAASLNGWNGSIKVNLTERFGLLADFGGDYGQRGCSACVGSTILPGTNATQLAPAPQPKPGGASEHELLVGPEFKVFKGQRFSANVRALAGIAHASSIAMPYQGHQLTFSGTNWFAASVGGSLDYKISNRVSYRILQPELLATITNRYGTLHAYPNLQSSTGLVFSFGSR